MKIAVNKNMPARRDEANVEIKWIFAERLRSRSIDQLHLAKFAEAEAVLDGGASDLLDQEAELRGVRVDDLAATIVTKHQTDTHEALLEIEGERQVALAGVRAAKRPEDIETIIAALKPETAGLIT